MTQHLRLDFTRKEAVIDGVSYALLQASRDAHDVPDLALILIPDEHWRCRSLYALTPLNLAKGEFEGELKMVIGTMK